MQEMSNEVDEHGLGMSSADANKPRLKWTRQLHQSFADAVSQLGGPDQATPKSVMRVMGVPGITLYHLKSHLQKYRLAKSRDHKAISTHEDIIISADYRPIANVKPSAEMINTRPQFDNSTDMLLLQLEVQRKLQEQIEVQRHLQMRIEAQGKYLQSVVRKAQETLASYSFDSKDMEAARSELSELVSAVDGYPSSSLSQATCVRKQTLIKAGCSTDSCLTWSQRPTLHNTETSDCSNNWTSAESNETDLLSSSENKGTYGDFSDGIRCNKRSNGLSEEIDLNR